MQALYLVLKIIICQNGLHIMIRKIEIQNFAENINWYQSAKNISGWKAFIKHSIENGGRYS